MSKRAFLSVFVGFCSVLFFASAFAEINRVRVVNDTSLNIYVHKGAFAPSLKIKPGEWKIIYYPFKVIPPNEKKSISTTKLAVTAGGRWMTTPNGITYLDKPKMSICLDYAAPEHAAKSGNRVWTITKKSVGIQPGCKVQGYKQPWFQAEK